MNTLEFYQRVLPSTGYYVLAYFTPGRNAPEHLFTKSKKKLAAATELCRDRGLNVYYATASYKADERRVHSNCDKLKAFYIDIDCGADKPFANWKDGVKFLITYLEELKLPKPMIVKSGNGLHVYWVLTEELSRSEWLPTANAIKATFPTWENPATGRSEPVFDPSVPADSSRILRPVGTINPKGGKRVELLLDAEPVTHDAIKQCVADHIPSAKAVTRKRSESASLIDKMRVKAEFPPAKPDLIVSKCKQVAWATQNQNEVREPHWYALMGVAAYCENPEETAVLWSNQHAGFDRDATIKKMYQWRDSSAGPTMCSRFENERPKGCEGCRFAGSINTPVMLGIQYEEEAPAATAPDQSAVNAVDLPDVFKRANGGIVAVIDEVEVPICDFDIYPVSYGRDEDTDYEVARFHWLRRHVGWQELVVRQAYLSPVSSEKDFAATIADQGIVFGTKKQTEVFRVLLREYMENLKRIKTISNIYSSMGWKENNTQFLLGDTLLKTEPDGKIIEESVSVPGVANSKRSTMFGSAGALSEWTALTELFDKAKMPEYIFALGVSFSAPFYVFSGLKGIAINLYGPTGAGKSLAQLIMQSVWGNPSELHMSAKTTANALYSRMGMYNNLPITIDEATMFGPKEMGDMLYTFTQGRDKARLNRHATERDLKTWAAPQILSSNRSIVATLVSGGMEADAHGARLLEVEMPAHPLFTKDTKAGTTIYNLVNANYGHAGRKLLRYVMETGLDVIRAREAQHRITFADTYGAEFAGHERFWEQAIIAADFYNMLASEIGLVRYDYREGTRVILEQLGVLRQIIIDNKMDTFDLLSDYLNEFGGSSVAVSYTAARKGVMDTARIPRGDLRVRFNLYRQTPTGDYDRGTVLIERRHFKLWLASRGVDIRDVMRDIAAENADATPKTKKAYLGKETPYHVGQQYVVGVDLTHPRLQGILTDADEAQDRAAFNKVVSLADTLQATN